MDRRTVILGSFLCFILGLGLIFWTNLLFSPEEVRVCNLSEGVVSTRGVFKDGYLEDECRVRLVLSSSRPWEGEMVRVTGDYDGERLRVFEWELI